MSLPHLNRSELIAVIRFALENAGPDGVETVIQLGRETQGWITPEEYRRKSEQERSMYGLLLHVTLVEAVGRSDGPRETREYVVFGPVLPCTCPACRQQIH